MLISLILALSWLVAAYNCVDPNVYAEMGHVGSLSQNHVEEQVASMQRPIDQSPMQSHHVMLKKVEEQLGTIGHAIPEIDSCADDQKAAHEEHEKARERILQVQKKLATNKEEIKKMETECRIMTVCFEDLQEKEDLLKRFGRVSSISSRSILDVWNDLERYRSYVMGLVQIRLYALAGLDGIVLEASEAKLPTVTQDIESTASSGILQASLQPSKENVALGGHHLRLIYDKVEATRALDLINVYKNVAFRSVEEEDINQVRDIDVSWQKCIFQIVQLMYKFRFIKENTLRAFFAHSYNLERTGMHIYDIFHQSTKEGFGNYHAFIPETDFMCTHWKTEHLHESLEVMFASTHGKVNKSCVLFIALKATVNAYLRSFDQSRTILVKELMESVRAPHFISALRRWPGLDTRDSQNSRYSFLKVTIDKLLNYFEAPPPLSSSTKTHPAEVTGYLLVFHILNFITKIHDNYEFANNFEGKDLIEYEIFKQHMKLIEAGLGLIKCINKVSDYGYFLAYPRDKIHSIPKQVTKEGKELMKMEALKLLKDYKVLKDSLEDYSAQNEQQNRWCKIGSPTHLILQIFTNAMEGVKRNSWSFNGNLWLIKRDEHVKCDVVTADDHHRLMNHLKTHYMLQSSHDQEYLYTRKWWHWWHWWIWPSSIISRYFGKYLEVLEQ